jgi:ParB family chromosome partitioning protein
MSNSGKKNRGLGRGLGALIPESESESEGGLSEIPVADIEPAKEQPRRDFDEDALDELAQSIEKSGLIQPLVVREAEDSYKLIAGERRWRASRRADIEKVPAVVRDVSDAEAYALALVENLHREDLNPVEEATAYQRLLNEFGYTQSELAEKLGKSRSSLSNSMRILDLPTGVLRKLAKGSISAGHARALVPLSDKQAKVVARRIMRQGLSVRQTEELVQELQNNDDEEARRKGKQASRYRDDAQTRDIKDKLQKSLGTKVSVKDKHGEGKIEIHYDDYEILQSVLDRIIE